MAVDKEILALIEKQNQRIDEFQNMLDLSNTKNQYLFVMICNVLGMTKEQINEIIDSTTSQAEETVAKLIQRSNSTNQ